MRAIARRSVLLAAAAFPAARAVADDASALVDVFAAMAAALSESNPPAFLKRCDPAMPGYDALEKNLDALVQQAELASSVEILHLDETGDRRAAELDWYLEIRGREPASPLVRRRDTLRCGVQKHGKQWRVVALNPISFFAPLRVNS